MAIVEPGQGMAVIERGGSGLRITIPATVELFNVLFLAAFLTIWAITEVAVIRHLLGGGEKKLGFLIIWLAGWTLEAQWQLTPSCGSLPARRSSSSIRRRCAGASGSCASRPARNSPLPPSRTCVSAPPQPKYIHGKAVISSPLTRHGVIAFDVGRETHHLGLGLDETEAKFVLEEMSGQVKSLRMRDEEQADMSSGRSANG